MYKSSGANVFLVSLLLFALCVGSLAKSKELQQLSLTPGNWQRVGVFKDGKELCGSVAFSQLPSSRLLFLGRVRIGGDSGSCAGHSWKLALFRLNQAAHRLDMITTVASPPFHVGKTEIGSAYDPYVAEFNGQVWVAFECAGPKISTSVCMTPFDETTFSVDLSRAFIAISGVRSSDGAWFSASAPKLISFHGGLYLYWTVVQGKGRRFEHLSTSGVQLQQRRDGGLVAVTEDNGSTERVLPIPSIASYAPEVLKTDPRDPTKSSVADVHGILPIGDYLIVTSGVGGGECNKPSQKLPGCYRLQISTTSRPLAPNSLADRVERIFQGAFSRQEYARVYKSPEGGYFLMGVDLVPGPKTGRAPGLVMTRLR